MLNTKPKHNVGKEGLLPVRFESDLDRQHIASQRAFIRRHDRTSKRARIGRYGSMLLLREQKLEPFSSRKQTHIRQRDVRCPDGTHRGGFPRQPSLNLDLQLNIPESKPIDSNLVLPSCSLVCQLFSKHQWGGWEVSGNRRCNLPPQRCVSSAGALPSR